MHCVAKKEVFAVSDPLKCCYCGGVISPNVSSCHHCGHLTPFVCSVCSKEVGGPLSPVFEVWGSYGGIYYNDQVYCFGHSPIRCCACQTPLSMVTAIHSPHYYGSKNNILLGENAYCKDHAPKNCEVCSGQFAFIDLIVKKIRLPGSRPYSQSVYGGDSDGYAPNITHKYMCPQCAASHVDPPGSLWDRIINP